MSIEFKKVVALAAALGPVSEFSCQNSALGAEFSREFVSAQMLGAGGAGITDLTGIDALFYNPANLARSQSVIGDIILVSPQIEASDNGVAIYRDIKANKNMLDIVGSVIGHPVRIGIQNASGASFRRTALALIERVDLQIALKNDPYSGIPVASVSSAARAGAAYGIGRSFASNTFHLGVTGLIIQKAEASLSVSALEAQSKLKDSGGKTILNDAMKRGVGVGAHIGALFTPEGNSSPEFSVVARNLGLTYSVGGKSPEQRPTAELQTVDVGLSLQPKAKNSHARISMDVYDVLNKSKENFYKRLHLGAEVTFSSVLGVQGGLNQGYSTYGVFFNAKLLRLDAGIFSEELGKYPGDTKSRSYFGRVTVGWTK